jgi:enoyl-CoA hydratase/carnithine racemase
MEFETIRFERANGIARLALNRPEKLNAFNVLVHRKVAAALDAVRRNAVGLSIVLRLPLAEELHLALFP